MASASSPPRPVGAAPPTVRHGTCRLTVSGDTKTDPPGDTKTDPLLYT